MKVVAQLVKHFWNRGELSLAEAAYLVEHGFVPMRELSGYDARLKAALAGREIVDRVAAELHAAEDARFKAVERLEARLMRHRVSGKRKRKHRARRRGPPARSGTDVILSGSLVLA